MFVAIVLISVVLLDILTKYLTVQLLLPLEREIVIIPHVISLSYVENRGAAFGMLADNRWVFMILSVILMIALALMLKFTAIKHPLFIVSVAMILGGGIGNMIDRVFIGYVVDFFKVTFIDFPVFNVADSAVVVGTCLLAVYIIFFDKQLTNKKSDGNLS